MTPCSPELLTLRLKTAFDVEFTFHKVNHLVDILVPFALDTQGFIPGWIERIARNNIQISYEFTRHAIGGRAVHAMDACDREGQRPALEVLFECVGEHGGRGRQLPGKMRIAWPTSPAAISRAEYLSQI